MNKDPRITISTVRPGSLTERSVGAARGILSGERRRPSAYLAFAGPAIVVSIAYIDPGNFATNIQAGAKYGYGLLWVVLLANLIAMLFQALSAKLGIVTGRNLAEMCRDQFPRPVVWAMWIVSEVAAMATDLAEFLGGAIGLSLVFSMPLFAGMVVTGIVTYGILMFERSGFRTLELIIGSLVGVIGLCYLIEMFIVPVDWSSAALHTVVPQIADAQALLLAVGIIGATVMPHAVYLHSGLTQARTPVRSADERRMVLRFSNQEVIIALTIAGMVNMAMVMMASGAFPCRSSRSRGDRNGLSHIDAAARHRGSGRVLAVPHCIGDIEFDGWNNGWPIDHAGLRRVPDSDLGSTACNNDTGFHRCRSGCEPNKRARHQSGCAQYCPATSHDRSTHLHSTVRHHGSVHQWPADQYCSDSRDRRGLRPQCFPDPADIRRADSGIGWVMTRPRAAIRWWRDIPLSGRSHFHVARSRQETANDGSRGTNDMCGIFVSQTVRVPASVSSAVALCVVAALASGLTMSAHAGDAGGQMPLKAAPALAPYYDWTGFYVGGHTAYSLGRANSTLSDPNPTAWSNSFGSLYGGLQAGYNYVLPSRLLLGIEADITFPYFFENGTIYTGGTPQGTTVYRPDRLCRDAARSLRLRVRSLADLWNRRIGMVAGALR